MKFVGLDHLVVNTRDVENSVKFYRDVLGMEMLRWEEYRDGKVGFVSARVSPETIIDIRPDPSTEKVTPNIDHYCLVLGPTDMKKLHSDLKAKGVRVREKCVLRGAPKAMGNSSRFGTRKATRLS